MATSVPGLSFKDKVVIVTGGSNGIGQATVSSFLEQGARVASLDIRVPSENQSGHNGNGTSSSIIHVKCNVSSDTEVRAAVQQVIDKWQTIDVLCNVAGITDRSGKFISTLVTVLMLAGIYRGIPADRESILFHTARVAETTDEELSRIMSIDFYGPFYMMRAVIPHFLAKPGGLAIETPIPVPKHRGTIVNVCSVAAARGGANGASYTAAKHALLGLTRNTAVGYAKEGVRCNAVLPGPVKTNIIAHSDGEVLHPDGGPAFQAVQKPLMGFAEPMYIARAILFLAGAESANGAELQIDDGYLVR